MLQKQLQNGHLHGYILITKIRQGIGSTYAVLRNLCAFIMLAGLIFTGIKILVSMNSPTHSSKWLVMLEDWFVGMVLLIFSHVLMVGIFYVSDTLTAIISENLIGMGGMNFSLIKQCILSFDSAEQIVYLIMLGYLIYLAIVFAVAYFKRLLWVCVLIVFAPIVSVMYSFGNRTKQIYNKWLREYILAVLVQPFHILTYFVLVSIPLNMVNSTGEFDIVGINIFEAVFALGAMSFIRPAEKYIRGLFEMNHGVANMASFDSGKQTLEALKDAGEAIAKKIAAVVTMVGVAVATGGAGLAAEGGMAAAVGATGTTAATGEAVGATTLTAGTGLAGETTASGIGLAEGMEVGNVTGSSGLIDMGNFEYMDTMSSSMDIGDFQYMDSISNIGTGNFGDMNAMNVGEMSMDDVGTMGKQIVDPMDVSGDINTIIDATEETDSMNNTNMGETNELSDDRIKLKDDSSEENNDNLDNTDDDSSDNSEKKKNDGDNNSLDKSNDRNNPINTDNVNITANNVNMEGDSIEIDNIKTKDNTETEDEKEEKGEEDKKDKEEKEEKNGEDKSSKEKDDIKLILDSNKWDSFKSQGGIEATREAANELYKGLHTIGNTFYLDGPPDDWKNRYNREENRIKDQKEKTKKNNEIKVQNHINNKENQNFIMEKEGIKEQLRKEHPNKSNEWIDTKAREKAKEKLKSMSQYVTYGISDIKQIYELHQDAERYGYTPEEAIRASAGYEKFNTNLENVSYLNNHYQTNAQTVEEIIPRKNAKDYYNNGYQNIKDMDWVDYLAGKLNPNQKHDRDSNKPKDDKYTKLAMQVDKVLSDKKGKIQYSGKDESMKTVIKEIENHYKKTSSTTSSRQNANNNNPINNNPSNNRTTTNNTNYRRNMNNNNPITHMPNRNDNTDI